MIGTGTVADAGVDITFTTVAVVDAVEVSVDVVKHRNNSPQICLTPATASFIFVTLTLRFSSDGDNGDNGDDGDNGEVDSTLLFVEIAAAAWSLPSSDMGTSFLYCIDRRR